MAPHSASTVAPPVVQAPDQPSLVLFNLRPLWAHEIDHVQGILYTDRMRPSVNPVPVER